MAGLTDSLARQSLIERAGHVFPNPWFDIASQYVPRDIKSTFQWAEYLYTRNAIYQAAVNRVVRYPITSIKIVAESGGEKDKEQYERLFEENLNMVHQIAVLGVDTLVYGNSFTSVYLPFDRFLKCPECDFRRPINTVDYQFKGMEFRAKCPGEDCGFNGVHNRLDIPSRDTKRFNLIRWSPHEIELDYNPWSGRYEYYWRPDADTISKVEQGDKLTLNEIPWSILEAVKEKKELKFSNDMIYHMKELPLSGLDQAWGIPPCMGTFSIHYYIALLRRANEAIFLDYILPFRIIHPQAQQGGQADPTMFIPMGSFVGRMKSMVQRHRRDPLDIQIAPIPIGYQTISGEAKALNLSEELKLLNEELLSGLGIPAELFYGTLTVQAMPSALRLFENTWSHLVYGYNRFLQWVADKAADYFSWDEVEVSLEPVTLADDMEKKQVMLQFAAGQAVAQSTVLRTYGLDFKEEMEKKIEDMRIQEEVNRDAQELATAEEQMAIAEGGPGAPGGTTPQDLMAEATMQAERLLGMPYEMRRSEMHMLRQANEPLYALTKQKMQELRQQAQTMGGQMLMQQGGMAPPGM